MMGEMETITITTNKSQQIVDITEHVKEIVHKSDVKEGICYIYTAHATCAVMINENWDPNIMLDIIDLLNDTIPRGKWRHDKVDDNGAAHIKASIIGPSEIVPVREGSLMLGKWQDIMLADFDGPKKREIFVDVLKK
ncbi:YjbQ family protein [Candidatus Woesearchaeota archaeon]|nr:YjbQ family protein [Candidatus Woesearchaeota archaeon]